MTYRMYLQTNSKSIPVVSRVVDLCIEHIGKFTHFTETGYGGDGWVVMPENGNWYLEVDKEENLMYISLLL